MPRKLRVACDHSGTQRRRMQLRSTPWCRSASIAHARLSVAATRVIFPCCVVGVLHRQVLHRFVEDAPTIKARTSLLAATAPFFPSSLLTSCMARAQRGAWSDGWKMLPPLAAELLLQVASSNRLSCWPATLTGTVREVPALLAAALDILQRRAGKCRRDATLACMLADDASMATLRQGVAAKRRHDCNCGVKAFTRNVSKSGQSDGDVGRIADAWQ